MKVTQVDPDRLCISDLNERKGFDEPDAEFGHIEIDTLTESIAEIGIVQPPLVRPFDGEFKDYEVVIGQRRTLAAQEVNNFDEFEDIDEIPVIVVDWDDGEALAASIAENVEAFREEVGEYDRARAIDRLKELRKWTNQDVADHLGVAKRSISDWLEPINDHWKEVDKIRSEEGRNEEEDLRRLISGGESTEEDPSIDVLQNVRRGTESPEESAAIMKTIEEEELSSGDVRKAKQRTDSGESMEQTITEVAKEKREQQQTTTEQREEVRITFTGSDADALREAAKENAATTNQYARATIRQGLVDGGFL